MNIEMQEKIINEILNKIVLECEYDRLDYIYFKLKYDDLSILVGGDISHTVEQLLKHINPKYSKNTHLIECITLEIHDLIKYVRNFNDVSNIIATSISYVNYEYGKANKFKFEFREPAYEICLK